LVSGSRDNKVIFWDTKTGQILKTIMIGRNLVRSFFFSQITNFFFSYRLQMLNGHMMEHLSLKQAKIKKPSRNKSLLVYLILILSIDKKIQFF
jgi:hypothetical protein